MITPAPGYLEGLLASMAEYGSPLAGLIDEVEGWFGLAQRDMELLGSLNLL